MVGLMLWVESGLKGCCGGLSNRSIVEGYRGGFAVVAVDFRCVCVNFAWWFDWQWWIGMWVYCVCFFCLMCLLCVCVFFAWWVCWWWRWVEKERDWVRERGRIKNNKERMFK